MSQNDNSDLGILAPIAIAILGCVLVGWLSSAAKEMFHALGEMFHSLGKFMVVFLGFAAISVAIGAVIFAGFWLIHKIYVAIQERASFERKLTIEVQDVAIAQGELREKVQEYNEWNTANFNRNSSRIYNMNEALENLKQKFSQLEKDLGIEEKKLLEAAIENVTSGDEE